jgi:2-polyprenyl-6-methoxyphenol hydroxylase-like FAD-dependent oxidoreductase
MAGLCVARALAAHYDRVTLVERDPLLDAPRFRPGVPQSRHVHALLESGRRALEHLFPGFTAELTAAGAVGLRFPQDVLWLNPSGWYQRHTGNHRGLSASRDLIEWTTRRMLLATTPVDVVSASEAVGLTATRDGSRVTGVRIRARGGGGRVQDLDADLVVDATGRGSHAPRWLSDIGYPSVPESRIVAHHGYASRRYAVPADANGDWKAIYLQSKPPTSTRTGLLFPIEQGQWVVSLGGAAGDHPPIDDHGFLEFARTLRSRVLYDTICDAEPVTSVYGYRRTENQRRHYERLRRWPEQFVVVGDAACAFNPVYGQGMSVAAMTALLVDAGLRRARSTRGLARRLQWQVAGASADAWMIATGEDLRYPTTEGARPDLWTRLMQRYLDRVLAAATVDPVVTDAFFDVFNLLRRPPTLFRPTVVAHVLAARWTPSAAGATGHVHPAPARV